MRTSSNILWDVSEAALEAVFGPAMAGPRSVPEPDGVERVALTMTLIGGRAIGAVHFQADCSLLAESGRDARQAAELLRGHLQSELLRRGLAVQLSVPEKASTMRMQGFDRGPDGTVCTLRADGGRAALGIRLTLSEGTQLEAQPIRELPSSRPPQARVEGPQELPSDLPTVLVVDDSEAARSVMRDALEAEGFEVLQADSTEAALRLLRERGRVGMVFTDLHMPGQSGSELIRHLKGDATLSTVPVVVVTARPSAFAEVDRSQVVTCMIQPVSPAAVIAVARRVLSQAS